jgi:release factor glutamine methyltransferase
MRCSQKSARDSSLRAMDANSYLVTELIHVGLNRREARWLVEEFSPKDHEGITAMRAAAQRRLEGEPIQYVLGHWPFRSLDLDLDARVLIPRPETEELVGLAFDELMKRRLKEPFIVDLGCGSGAIGLSLLFELRQLGVRARLVAVDSSPDALDVTRANATKHGLDDVTTVQSSWFDDLDPWLRGSVDMIVANPPYVGGAEFATLDPVLGYEPFAALVSGDTDHADGFSDLQEIIGQACPWLVANGLLICEHGNMHREAVLQAAQRAMFSNVQDLDDMFGNPRFLIAKR